MTVTIVGVVESSHDCRERAEDASHRDELDIDPNGSYSVAVATEGNPLWMVSVSSVE